MKTTIKYEKLFYSLIPDDDEQRCVIETLIFVTTVVYHPGMPITFYSTHMEEMKYIRNFIKRVGNLTIMLNYKDKQI